MISSFQICGQHIAATKHGVDPAFIAAGGWPGYVQKYVQPEIEWGCRRFMFHIPFSAKVGLYQFDQYIEAKNDRLITTVDFVPTMRALRAQGVEAIAYIGTRKSDPDFLTRTGEYKGDNYLSRVLESVKVILDAGASIAFDWANDDKEGSVEYETMDAVRALCKAGKASAYIEPIGHRDFPHTHNWPSITQEGWYHQHKDDWWVEKPTGEVVRWVDLHAWSHPEGGHELAAAFRRIIADGHTPCGITGYLRQAGYQAKDFTQ